VQRLGNPISIAADVRLMAASSTDIEQVMREGRMREDFYYRLNVVSIYMPPLRERIDDIPLLVSALASEQAESLGGEPISFTEEAMARLQAYPWAGNVRELRNYIERCHILKQGERISEDSMLPLDQSAPAATADLANTFHAARESFERSYILHHLNKHDWNISRTAEDIGMERSQLHRKIKGYGLDQAKRKQA
jgi:two-component system nitrogen regulation response regulator NtrX